MKLFPGRSKRVVLASLALIGVGVVGCHDADTAPKTIDTPSGPMRDLGTVIVHVNLKNHTIDVQPAGSSQAKLPPGVSARFFGTQAQIEYILTELSNTPLTGGDIQYNIHPGVSNLLTFAIGTNSPHVYPAHPQDTMGVYVYYAIGPYNIQSLGGPCGTGTPTCSVRIDSADGVYPFTNPTPQPYVYWKTILEGGGTNAQGPGPFETKQDGIGGIDYRRRMSFFTHGGVTDFSFGLAVAAPWVEPNENRWKVFYTADSLPNRIDLTHLRSEPDWRVFGTGGGVATIQTTGCAPGDNRCLQIVSTTASAAPETLLYYRSDSLRTTQDGYIAATVTATPSALSTTPSIFLGLKDTLKLVQLGISATLTGFTDSTGAFIPGFTVPTDPLRTTWRVSKVGTTSASIYAQAVGGAPLLTIPYASLPAAPVRGVNPTDYDHYFFFGNVTQPITSPDATSLWSNINYEIGVLGP
jgi:hypothetical protein